MSFKQNEFNVQDLRPPLLESKSRFVCSICNKKFASKNSLAVHMNQAERHKHACSFCSLSFIFRKDLVLHNQSQHRKQLNWRINKKTKTLPPPPRPEFKNKLKFKCTFCNKFFSFKSDYNRHTLVHSGNRPFICSLCPKRFTQESNLRRHLNVHQGIKPFSCENCLLKFTDKSSLNIHAKKCRFKPTPLFDFNETFSSELIDYIY